MARKLIVEIVGDTSNLERAFQKAGAQTQTFGGRLGGLGKAAGIAAGGAAFGGLTIALKRGFDEMKEGQAVSAQTAAVLKSTGGAARVSASHIGSLANSISKMSGIDDEAVQSGENMLLTFTNIRNEVGKGNAIFDSATKILVDMSVALGQDMKSSAIQLGKALNDPIKGLTALQRVGVTFTEQQKEQIKGLVGTGNAMKDLDTIGVHLSTKQKNLIKDTGETTNAFAAAKIANVELSDAQRAQLVTMSDGSGAMKAQKIILGELNKEFGGSAKAMGETLPGQINKLTNAFDNLAAQGLAVAFQKAEELRPTVEALIGLFKDLQPILEPLARLIWDVLITPMKILADLIRGDFSQAWKDVKQPIIDVRNLLAGFWDTIKAPFNTMIASVKGGLSGIATFAEEKAAALANAFTSIPSRIADFGGALVTRIQNIFAGAKVGEWITGVVANWAGFISDLPAHIADFGGALLAKLKDFVAGKNGIGAQVKDFFTSTITDWASSFADLPKAIGNAALSGVKSAMHLVKELFGKLFGSIGQWVMDQLGIHSPSKVFHEIGVNVIKGLVQGVETLGSKLENAVWDKITGPFLAAGDYIGDLFTGGEIGSDTPIVALPEFFNATHDTLGLPGYPAVDVFGRAGAIALSPAEGTIVRVSGRPWDEGWSNGPGSAIGLSLYLVSKFGEYFMTHFDRLFVGLRAFIRRGTPLGTIGPMVERAPHIHEGFHRFATGGVVTKPTFALIGEAGPEAVIPLSKMRGGQVQVTVNLPNYLGDKREVAQELRKELQRIGRDNAINPLAI